MVVKVRFAIADGAFIALRRMGERRKDILRFWEDGAQEAEMGCTETLAGNQWFNGQF